MINVMTTILKMSISHFQIELFLALHPMESISLNSFVLLEHLAMLLTSTLAWKLPKQGYRCHKLGKTFSKFYRRYYDLISKFQVGLKSLLREGLSEPEFCGERVYKLKKSIGLIFFQRSH